MKEHTNSARDPSILRLEAPLQITGQGSKDNWDKFSMVAKAVASIVVAVLVVLAAQYYKERQSLRDADIHRVEALNTYFPYLNKSPEDAESAFMALEVLLGTEYAIKVANVYSSEGAIRYLQRKVMGKSQQVRKLAADALSKMGIIVLIDSKLAKNIYDDDTKKAGKTNADDIYPILRKHTSAPIYRDIVVGPFKRTGAITALRPSLIICHFSSFDDSGMQIEKFVLDVAKQSPNTKFLMYSRNGQSFMQKEIDKWKGNLPDIELVGIPINSPSFRIYKNGLKILNGVEKLLGLTPQQLGRRTRHKWLLLSNKRT